MNATHVPLWYTRCPLPTATGVALDTGLLEQSMQDMGCVLRPIEASGDADARQSHFTHSLKNLFRHGGNIPPIWSRSRGADTALVGISRLNEYQAILALPGAAIRTVQDLAGKRLGLPVRTSGEIDFWRAMCLRGFESALRTAGMALSDVELVELPVEERYIDRGSPAASGASWMWSGAARARRQQAETLALIRGEIDAIYTSGAMGAQLQALLQATVVSDLRAHGDPAVSVNNQCPAILTVDRSFARERPDVVAAYLRALDRATQWAGSDRDTAYRIWAREVGAPEEWIPHAYGEAEIGNMAVSLDAALVGQVEDQKAFLLRHRFIDTDFPIEDWIDPVPMQLARQAAA